LQAIGIIGNGTVPDKLMMLQALRDFLPGPPLLFHHRPRRPPCCIRPSTAYTRQT